MEVSTECPLPQTKSHEVATMQAALIQLPPGYLQSLQYPQHSFIATNNFKIQKVRGLGLVTFSSKASPVVGDRLLATTAQSPGGQQLHLPGIPSCHADICGTT